MLEVVADTSFLIYVANNPSPLLKMLEEYAGAYRLLVPRIVERELKRLALRKDKKGREAKNALRYAEGQQRVCLAGKIGDDTLLKYAENHRLALATLDMQLVRKARRAGVTVIRVGRGRLIVEGAAR